MQIQFGTSKTIIEAIEAENKFSPLCKSGLMYENLLLQILCLSL